MAEPTIVSGMERETMPSPGISFDTLGRAQDALRAAKQMISDHGADQFSMTFAQADGTLAGRITMVRGELVVYFDLLGSTRSG